MGSLLDLLSKVQLLPEILPSMEVRVLEEVVLLAESGASIQLWQSISGKLFGYSAFPLLLLELS